MKYLFIIISGLIFFTSVLFAQEERKVLVEVFTNSHCPLCPAAHNVIDNYLAGPNGDKISYIYYHMVYPYPDDQLYIESMEGSDARNAYYNPVSATPQGWFDGTHQGSTSGWAANLDNLVSTQSPLKIILSGTRNSTQFNINAQLTRTGDIADNDLVIHFVVVEDLFYDGRNSVSNHKHVMRKMLPTPDGQSFTIDLNETKDIPQTINLDPLWDADSLNVVIFVQSLASKAIYQSETISYNELSVTGLDDLETVPSKFVLEQNYPNPFNPSTTIRYSIPTVIASETKQSQLITLKVYDVLGNEVATLVNEEKTAGSYEVEFAGHSDAGQNLTSGIYFYKLQTGSIVETKKMLLLK
ncbi:MAG: Omp28-related outer membrane protein [Ignavibacteriaceae bacterium]|nr:Omp28-related outer membrane protein [Ignavibacteriaceae bacterium]